MLEMSDIHVKANISFIRSFQAIITTTVVSAATLMQTSEREQRTLQFDLYFLLKATANYKEK